MMGGNYWWECCNTYIHSFIHFPTTKTHQVKVYYVLSFEFISRMLDINTDIVVITDAGCMKVC